jgi:hypothetical protein
MLFYEYWHLDHELDGAYWTSEESNAYNERKTRTVHIARMQTVLMARNAM